MIDNLLDSDQNNPWFSLDFEARAVLKPDDYITFLELRDGLWEDNYTWNYGKKALSGFIKDKLIEYRYE